MNRPLHAARNPGPRWGYRFLLWAERWWPRGIFRPGVMLGTWIALPFMPAQRRHSRAYLAVVLGRRPTLLEVWRHFFAFADFLVLKLRVARGGGHRCVLDPESGAGFSAFIASEAPALFGTFHFGHSELLGFHLGRTARRPVTMIRLRVENSDDIAWLGRQFQEWISFVWVNEPADIPFALKDALEAGRSLALQCDRLEFAAKAEPFQFLGRARFFPFTIYHLAVLFRRPVVFCFGVPLADGTTEVVASPVFTPAAAERAANFAAARAHFQAVLVQLETLVRQHPTLWFNFLPLNRESPTPAPAG
ncbi:MAG TPA: hypothetical protein VHD62_04555 [Opitutaceae bacterium]|nr:hypothetical protein [Opitutaceae bacterium]